MAQRGNKGNGPGTAIVDYDVELARMAQASRDSEAASATGNFLTIRGGTLQWRGAAVDGNKMDVVVLASVFEHDWYGDDPTFDPDSPKSPECYAMGVSLDGMAPDREKVENPQGDANGLCAACWANGFGSDPRGGRGKACQNRRRLAVIPAPTGGLNAAAVETAEMAFLRLPVMSVAGYSNFVMQIADTMKLPSFGAVVEISVQPDPKSQFRVMFKPKNKVDKALLPILMDRSKAATSLMLAAEYPKNSEMQKDRPARRTAPVRGRQASPPPARGRGPVANQVPKKPRF